jgi:predicted dehydrogenase
VAEPLGVAVLGCGRMGRRRAEALAKLPNARLISVADPDRGRGEALSAELHVELAASPESAIADPRVEAVVISTPNTLHTPLASSALELGRHVFLEKPLAPTWGEARQLVELARTNRRVLCVGSNLRYFQNVRRAREIVQSGALGTVLFARGWVGHDGWVLKTSPWSSDPSMIGAGGTLLDNGCHLIDIARWVLGREPEAAEGAAFHRMHELPPSIEDNFVGLLTLAGGVPLSFQCSWTEWNGYLYLEIYGDAGRLVVDGRGDAALCAFHPRKGEPQIADFAGAPRDSFAREIGEFVAAARGAPGDWSVATGDDAERVIATVETLYGAAREGRRLRIPLQAAPSR